MSEDALFQWLHEQIKRVLSVVPDEKGAGLTRVEICNVLAESRTIALHALGTPESRVTATLVITLPRPVATTEEVEEALGRLVAIPCGDRALHLSHLLPAEDTPAEPTPVQRRQHPPDGLYEGIRCTCTAACVGPCKGQCGCPACRAGWSDEQTCPD